jgi:hypothetical protein
MCCIGLAETKKKSTRTRVVVTSIWQLSGFYNNLLFWFKKITLEFEKAFSPVFY